MNKSLNRQRQAESVRMNLTKSSFLYGFIAVAFGTLMILLFPTGFGGGGYDDQRYLDAAHMWMQHFPYVGTTHWELRSTLVLPLATLLSTFGDRISVAMSLPIFVSVLFVAFNFFAIHRTFGRDVAVLWSLIFLTTPLYIKIGSTLFPEIVEMLFATMSVWLFYFGTGSEKRRTCFILAGLTAAAAIMTRETSAWIVLAYGLYFILFDRRRWMDYLWIAASLAIPLILEFLWLYHATGHPFYRQLVDMGHSSIPDTTLSRAFSHDSHLIDSNADKRWEDPGIFRIHWAINPALSLLVDARFGFSGAILAIASVYARFGSNIEDFYKNNTTIRMIGISAIISFVFTTYVLVLYPDQRYYIYVLYCITLVLAFVLANLLSAGRKIVGLGLLLVAVGTNLVLTNTMRPLDTPAKAAMAIIENHQDVIYVGQPRLAGYLATRLNERGLTHRVRIGTPPKGALFVYVEEGRADCARARALPGTRLIECRVVGEPLIQRVAKHILPAAKLPGILTRGGARATLNRML